MSNQLIIKVAFEDRQHPGAFKPGGYTYVSEIPVKLGDVVIAPTKFGKNRAKVVALDVPPSEYAAFADRLRHITEFDKKAASTTQMNLATAMHAADNTATTDLAGNKLPF